MSDQPHRPSNLSPYALACLEALAASGLGHTVSIGGALGLLHYLDYRSTHDVDAWWSADAGSSDRERVLGVIEATLATSGEIRRRQWGDVVSIELRHEGKTVFSFQVATRSALLRPAVPAPWTDVLLDSLPDLVASKMVALVERGAPRDFRDIHALCQAGLIEPAECWQLWRERQQLGGSDTDAERAHLAIQTHLARIAQHRPLADIAEPGERATAAGLRHWFATEFLDALPD